MSTAGPSKGPPGGIPTLTEVVPWPGQTPAVPAVTPVLPVATQPPAALVMAALPAAAAASPAAAASALPVVAAPPAATGPPVAGLSHVATVAQVASIGEAELTQRVLVDLQRQIDLMLEVRLREALAPVLSRAADALIRDARKELTIALRDAVARSVAQELARRQDG